MLGSFMATEFGSQINLKLNIGEYEISIVADNSCRKYHKSEYGISSDMIRFAIAVFRGKDNITEIVFNPDNLISKYEAYGTEENIFTAMEFCRNNKTI